MEEVQGLTTEKHGLTPAINVEVCPPDSPDGERLQTNIIGVPGYLSFIARELIKNSCGWFFLFSFSLLWRNVWRNVFWRSAPPPPPSLNLAHRQPH